MIRQYRRYRWIVDAVIVGVLLGLVCFSDLAFGAPLGISLGVFALFPVMLATRRLGTQSGIATAVLATLALALEQSWRVSAASPALMWNLVVNGVFLTLTAALLGRWRRVQTRLEMAASTDPLTGIANRRALRIAADRELRRQARSKQPLSVVHIDLDNFKRLNDAHGHAEGDRVLSAVARLLTSGRATDTAARTGGDEFVVLLPDTGAKQARIMVDRMRECLAEEMSKNALWQHVSCSIGIATFLQPAPDPETLIAAADESMYEVKRNSKNGVRQVVIDGAHKTEFHRVA